MNTKTLNSFFTEARFNPNKPGPMEQIAQTGSYYLDQRLLEEAHKLATIKLNPSQRHASLLMIARLAALGACQ